MRNIKLIIQYEGTSCNGWQIQSTVSSQQSAAGSQKNVTTIQGALQKTIKKITGEDTKVTGAGRTDSGVHAIAQVASFKTTSGLLPDIFKRALNACLPDYIRVMDASDVDMNFNPRYDAKRKVYFYIISNSRDLSPFLFRYAWKIPHRLNIDGMKSAVEFLKGRQDFSAFRASGCGARNPVRTVFDISLSELEALDFMDTAIKGRFLKIQIEADSFLRHMVRNMVGTIVKIGLGKIRPEDMKGIISSRDRRNAGVTAPAKGLFLERVIY